MSSDDIIPINMAPRLDSVLLYYDSLILMFLNSMYCPPSDLITHLHSCCYWLHYRTSILLLWQYLLCFREGSQTASQSARRLKAGAF